MQLGIHPAGADGIDLLHPNDRMHPGVSVDSTALASGINANLQRRWIVLSGRLRRPND